MLQPLGSLIGPESFGVALLQQQSPPIWQLFVPWIAIFAIFYFIAIRPARIKQQRLAEQIDALKKGDKVITTGGIYGEVVGNDNATVILKIADDVRIRILKSGIAGLDGESQGDN